jgi:hypothetical protein
MRLCPVEEPQRRQQAVERCLTGDPASLDADQDGHDAETAPAARDHVWSTVAALAREPARRMGKIPKISERLPLHEIEQGVRRIRFG